MGDLGPAGTARQPVPATATDDQLVEAVRSGDDAAFDRLYRRYHARITGYVRGIVRQHELAEEIAQEAFISALRRLRRTDGRIAFRPWIHEIAKNAAIDHLRARRRRGTDVALDDSDGLAGELARRAGVAVAPDAAFEQRQALDDLCGAFGGLTGAHHRILVLRELEGLTYEQLGERLGMNRSQVESTLFRARRRLEEEYTELVSGRRCERVQARLAADLPLHGRDGDRVRRHMAHCRDCRREAVRVRVPAAVAA